MPRVSVVTASFNHAPFLRSRIDSLLQQTFRDFEWIIVDDGSTDGSHEILARAAVADRRIRLVVRHDNRGMPATTRQGISLATGDLIHRAESDDACDPTFLEKTVAVFDANPQVVLVSTATRRMDEHGRLSGGLLQRRSDALLPKVDAFKRLLRRNYIAGPATLFSRESHDSVGGFGIPPYQICCDYHLHLRLAVIGDIAYLADRLYFSRSHGNNLSGQLGRELNLCDFEREGYTLVRDAVAFAGDHWPNMRQLEKYALRQVSLTAGAPFVNHVRRIRGPVSVSDVLDIIEKNDPGVTTSVIWYWAVAKKAAIAFVAEKRTLLFATIRRLFNPLSRTVR